MASPVKKRKWVSLQAFTSWKDELLCCSSNAKNKQKKERRAEAAHCCGMLMSASVTRAHATVTSLATVSLPQRPPGAPFSSSPTPPPMRDCFPIDVGERAGRRAPCGAHSA